MATPAHVHPTDLYGLARLAADATGALTDVVEAMHAATTRPSLAGRPSPGTRVGGPAGLAYSSVRTVTRWVGNGLDVALPPILDLLAEAESTPQRDAFLSALAGVLGDHLHASRNPLAPAMQLRRRGQPLATDAVRLASTLPRVSPRIAVLVHGLCGHDAQWKRRPADYGAALEREFGFTPLYLRYNSGLHISSNGQQLARLLERLVEAWPVPVEDILLVGHSMGGLVLRSAHHYAVDAGRNWPRLARRAVFLGTPHHGAPLERGGAWLGEVLQSVPFAAPLAPIGRLRSAGITDLRHGTLVDEDWHGRDRFARSADRPRAVLLPEGLDVVAIAASTGARRGDLRDRLVGDGLVPVASALGRHPDPKRELGIPSARRHVLQRTHHMDLLGHGEAWAFLKDWLR